MIAVGRTVFCAVVLTAALLVEVTVMSRLPLPGATPDLLLLAVLSFGLAYGRVPGAAIGFAAGLVSDLTPPTVTVVGREALVLCLVGYVAGIAREMHRTLLAAVTLAAVASAGAPLLFAAVGELAGDGVVQWPGVFDLLPSAVAYNVALAPILVLGIVTVARRLRPPEPVFGRLR